MCASKTEVFTQRKREQMMVSDRAAKCVKDVEDALCDDLAKK